MKRLTLWMIALAALPTGTLFAQDITGTWQGSLGDFRMVFKISQADNQSLTAVLYSIDTGEWPITFSAITQEGATIKIDGLDWERLRRQTEYGRKFPRGTWTEGAQSFPLNLGRATPETAWPFPRDWRSRLRI